MSNLEKEIRDADGRRPASQAPRHPDAPYEPKDINFGCILALIIAAGCVFAAMFGLDWYFFHAQGRIEDQRRSSPYTRSSAGATSLPPPPQLEQIKRMEGKQKQAEGQPVETFNERLAEMERLLHSSGPAGEKGFVQVPAGEKGFVHVPIEQAMKEIVKQLPVRKQPSDEALHPVYAGSSNSGRMLPGAPPWSEY